MKGLDAAIRYVKDTIRLAGCEDVVQIDSYKMGTKHVLITVRNKETGATATLPISKGSKSFKDRKHSLQKMNARTIRGLGG